MKPAVGRKLDAIGDWLLCGACLRVRISPIHGIMRALGICPGDQPPDRRRGRWSVE